MKNKTNGYLSADNADYADLKTKKLNHGFYGLTRIINNHEEHESRRKAGTRATHEEKMKDFSKKRQKLVVWEF